MSLLQSGFRVALLFSRQNTKTPAFTNINELKSLGLESEDFPKYTDLILHDPKRKCLFLIDFASSQGPVSNSRIDELEEVFRNIQIGRVFVSVFNDFEEFNRHSNDIAWGTHVWIADNPDHMIHFNGDRFMGPRK